MSGKIAAPMVLLALVLVPLAAGEPPVVKYCVQDQQQEDKLRAMMAESMDQAFKDNFAHLFDIWVKQEGASPERPQRGANNAVSAYLRAQRSLQNWKPQRC